jgi:hypothetical protein
MAVEALLGYHRGMTRRGFYIRLAISILIDVLNFTVGRVPIIGEGEDGVSALVLFLMWGPIGLLSLWELADVTEQIDALVPTATLIALYVGWKKGFIGKANAPRAPTEPPPRQIPP